MCLRRHPTPHTGVEGLRGLCVPKAVAEDRFPLLMRSSIPPAWQLPLPPHAVAFGVSLVTMFYGPGLLYQVGASGWTGVGGRWWALVGGRVWAGGRYWVIVGGRVWAGGWVGATAQAEKAQWKGTTQFSPCHQPSVALSMTLAHLPRCPGLSPPSPSALSRFSVSLAVVGLGHLCIAFSCAL